MQIAAVTVINHAPPAWRDLITTAVPALVALIVVWLGGRQQRARQRDDAAASERRWAEQRAFERKRLAIQQRRNVYAKYLAKLDEMGYLTTHALGHRHPDHPPMCEDHQEDAWQDWMQAHQRLVWLTQEIALVGSPRVYGLAYEVAEIFRDLDVLGTTPEAVQAWFFDGDEEPGPAFKRYRAIMTELLLEAREEVNAFPIDEETDSMDLEDSDGRSEVKS